MTPSQQLTHLDTQERFTRWSNKPADVKAWELERIAEARAHILGEAIPRPDYSRAMLKALGRWHATHDPRWLRCIRSLNWARFNIRWAV